MARKTPPSVLYVLQRLNWQHWGNGFARLPGATRLRSYQSRAVAERTRQKRERDARNAVNPFTCGGRALHYQTSLDADRLHDWLLDAGIEPPARAADGSRDWAAWWDKNYLSLSEAQKEKVWEALDRVKFFEVVERPARPLGYAVVRINWHYNDNFYVAEEEGGSTFYVYRDRKKAEYDCKESNDMAHDMVGDNHDDELAFDSSERRHRRLDPLGPTPTWEEQWEGLQLVNRTKFWEVIEVELDEL
jgi:hypothetical protein